MGSGLLSVERHRRIHTGFRSLQAGIRARFPAAPLAGNASADAYLLDSAPHGAVHPAARAGNAGAGDASAARLSPGLNIAAVGSKLRYGAVAQFFHWTTAVLVVVAFTRF